MTDITTITPSDECGEQSAVILQISDTLRLKNYRLTYWAVETRRFIPQGTEVMLGSAKGRVYEDDTWSRWEEARYFHSLSGAVERIIAMTMADAQQNKPQPLAQGDLQGFLDKWEQSCATVRESLQQFEHDRR